MTDELLRLSAKDRKGSKPRCHRLTEGSRQEVAARLTALAAPFAMVSTTDHWMPVGFDQREEAQLHKASSLLDPDRRHKLLSWWLAAGGSEKRTPNFDIASTCTIQGDHVATPGLLLVEAKAHDVELDKERAGRKLEKGQKKDGRALTEQELRDRQANHESIGRAIQSACAGLQSASSFDWKLSRDKHYQMSNRFAWAWKLTELGVPVVLVYLGFLHAKEMRNKSRTPLSDPSDWEKRVKEHSRPLFPEEFWNRPWTCNEEPLIPLIRSAEVPFDCALTADVQWY